MIVRAFNRPKHDAWISRVQRGAAGEREVEPFRLQATKGSVGQVSSRMIPPDR